MALGLLDTIEIIFKEYVLFKKSVVLALSIINVGSVYALETKNELRYDTGAGEVFVAPEGYEYSFTLSASSSIPSGNIVRANGDVMTSEQVSRLKTLLSQGMGEFLGTKVAVSAPLNSGSYGSSTVRTQTIDLPKTLPISQVVDVEYQANSHQNDSDSSTLIITPFQSGASMGHLFTILVT